mmetsp:Transcript_120595/g.234872  ORF Transcript_120595/g.234872 Transcript_120595/m.234872 type:complete len:274 (-) Transcript_120595:369-1190(-)
MSKTVLVTGGNAGIGLALCQQLLVDHGCTVFMCSRNIAKGEAALSSLSLPEDVAARCTVVELDVSSDESVAAGAETVKSALGETPLYGIVNNAGTGLGHGVSGEQVVNTNFFGPKRVIDTFAPLLDSADSRIVNVGSGAAGGYVKRLGETDEARMLMNGQADWEELADYVRAKQDCGNCYGLSKAALAAFTQALPRLYPNVVSSCCSPGFIDTNMTKGYGAKKGPAEGTPAIKKLLLEPLEGNGWYYGSDGERSPYHFMRNPGEPPYDGVMPF